jgi:hypothetical protein
VADDPGIATSLLSFARPSATATRTCNSFLLTGGERLGRRRRKTGKSSKPVPTSYSVSGLPYKEGNSPEPISGDCLKRAELKTKESDNPHFILGNHNVNVAYYVSSSVPSTVSSECEISLHDAHELFSCIQTDGEEVIRRFICCGFVLRTRRIEGAGHLFTKYVPAANEMPPQPRCRYVESPPCKICLSLVREEKFT